MTTAALPIDVGGAAADFLYRLPRNAPGVGMVRATELLRRVGNPQDAMRSIHVAGTAGKGSVSAFVSTMLSAHGFRVGAYTSPHVRTILERLRVDGVSPTGAEFAAAVDAVARSVTSMRRTAGGVPTFFEALNAVAFTHFAGAHLDYAVIETGIGGLLDATNAITRVDKLAVITRIGIDHTKVLGSTVAEIAWHKAGILPHGGRGIVLRHHQASVRATVDEVARDRACRVDVVDPRAVTCRVDPSGTTLCADGWEFPLGLQGRHQGENAALAVRAVQQLARRDAWTVDPAAIAAGLAATRLPGRFERHLVDGRVLILDGAHNAVKLTAFVDAFRALYPGECATFVLASKADKDVRAVLAVLAPITASIVATEFPTYGAGPVAPSVPARRIADLAHERGTRAVVVERPDLAIRAALDTGDGPVAVTGSFLHLAAADPLLRHTEV
jgi:dihydrofolate synthase / folylpolyglutamate synthase